MTKERSRSKIYLAYGSNMNIGQMAHRCPTAKVIGKAILENYRLTFRGRSRDGAGVATIIPECGSQVPCLLWEIQPTDEASLDRYEGYPIMYTKKVVIANMQGQKLKAMVYIMTEQYNTPAVPSDAYFKCISDGYKEAGIPRAPLLDARERVWHEVCRMNRKANEQHEPQEIRENGGETMKRRKNHLDRYIGKKVYILQGRDSGETGTVVGYDGHELVIDLKLGGTTRAIPHCVVRIEEEE
jgi:gamma-glutamylcyclotransferase (GGCT)/AIG2-like uncharacterized protein YtfP